MRRTRFLMCLDLKVTYDVRSNGQTRVRECHHLEKKGKYLGGAMV